MFETKYSKFLTIVLVVIIVAIMCNILVMGENRWPILRVLEIIAIIILKIYT